MRKENLLFSVAHFLVALIVFFLGSFLIVLSLSEPIRFWISHLLFAYPWKVFAVGCSIVFSSLLLFLVLYIVNTKRYYQINLDTFNAIALVDLHIIKEYLNTYFKESFPDQQILARDVVVKNDNSLEIITEMTEVDREKQEEFLAKMEKELASVLKDNLGYHQKLSLTLVF